MTFPVDAARATSLDGSFGTNHTINLPSGIVAGSLVVILMGVHDGAGTVGVPAGWTIWPVDGGDPEFSGASAITPDARVIYRVCDGTEGASIVVTTSLSRGCASIAWRIEGHDPAYAPDLRWDTGTSGANADPPFHDPHGWEGLDTLWLAGAVTRATGLSGTPTNYSNVAGAGPGGASVSVRGASRQLNSTNDNPSTFTKGSTTQHHIVCTIAIKPVDDETIDHSPHDSGSGLISRTTANANSHPVRLPPDVQIGDRIIVGFGFDAPTGQVASFPAGWTVFLGPTSSGSVRALYAYRDADGSEGSTVTVTTSGSSTASAAWSKRVRGYDAAVAPEGSTSTGTSTTADPPSHSPSWGVTAASLFVASAAVRVSTSRFVNGTPASYEKVVESPAVRNVTNGMGVRAASRELTAASENPAAFGGHSSVDWAAATIAVKGGAGGLPPARVSAWIA